MKKEHDEKWLLSKGWTKVEGIRIDHDMLSPAHEITYFSKSAIKDVIKECYFYYNDDLNPEFASEDLDECIKYQEESDEELDN